MMEIKPGTFLGKRTMTDPDDKTGKRKVLVDVIYKTETEGELAWNDGINHAGLDAKQYAEIVREYRKKNEISEIIDDPEEEIFVAPQQQNLEQEILMDNQEIEFSEETALVAKKKKKKEKKEKVKRISAGSEKNKPWMIPAIAVGVAVIIVLILTVASEIVEANKRRAYEKEHMVAEITTVEPEVTTEPVTEEMTTQEPTSEEESTKPVKEEKGYYICVLTKDVKTGEVLQDNMIEKQHISKKDYDEIAGIRYVSAFGETYNGTVTEWENSENVIGKRATRNLKAGDIVITEDFQMMQDAASGGMDVHLYAVIDSDGMDAMTIDLGHYILGSGNIEDILNSNGESILSQGKDK